MVGVVVVVAGVVVVFGDDGVVTFGGGWCGETLVSGQN